MRRSLIVVLAAASLVFGCKGKEPEASAPQAAPTQTVAPPPVEKPIIEKARFGSVLAPDQTVREEKNTFTREERIYLTVWFTEPSQDLLARIQWFDDTGIMLTEERRPTLGMKETTFNFDMGRPKPGNYRAVVLAGDKVAGEYNFVITQ